MIMRPGTLAGTRVRYSSFWTRFHHHYTRCVPAFRMVGHTLRGKATTGFSTMRTRVPVVL